MNAIDQQNKMAKMSTGKLLGAIEVFEDLGVDIPSNVKEFAADKIRSELNYLEYKAERLQMRLDRLRKSN